MLKAALYGLLAGSTLVFGALIGLAFKIQRRVIAVIMAFGAGVLISTLAFDLMGEAYKLGGFDSSSIGFVIGAVFFIFGDWAVDHWGGHTRKDTLNKRHLAREPKEGESSGLAIFIGALLDGIPESASIGVGLLAGQSVGLLVLVAVFLSNLPEGISGAVSMVRAGWSKVSIVCMWAAVAVLSSLSSLFGYSVLSHSSPDARALVMAIAAGAILAMVSATMIPEAFDDEGRLTPLITPAATVAGFLLASILSGLTRV
jgi:ZIP family zinc transporter